MARISREQRTSRHRRSKAPRNSTLVRTDEIVVRVASFAFRFGSIKQLRQCLEFFERKIHPSSRIPSKKLSIEFGDDWRKLRSWEIERWFERLPMYLFEKRRREKVGKALRRALMLAESGRLR
jgi:hypothetical protein